MFQLYPILFLQFINLNLKKMYLHNSVLYYVFIHVIIDKTINEDNEQIVIIFALMYPLMYVELHIFFNLV